MPKDKKIQKIEDDIAKTQKQIADVTLKEPFQPRGNIPDRLKKHLEGRQARILDVLNTKLAAQQNLLTNGLNQIKANNDAMRAKFISQIQKLKDKCNSEKAEKLKINIAEVEAKIVELQASLSEYQSKLAEVLSSPPVTEKSLNKQRKNSGKTLKRPETIIW